MRQTRESGSFVELEFGWRFGMLERFETSGRFETIGRFERNEASETNEMTNEREARSPRTAGRVTRRPRRARAIWHCAAALLAALAIGAPAQAESAFTRANDAFALHGGQALDLVLVRPLGVGRIVFGFVCFIPIALFAEVPFVGWRSPTSEAAEVWDLFVLEPFEETFQTPLGEFGEE